MRIREVSILLSAVVLGFSSGCLSAPTPTAVPLPTATPSPVIPLDAPTGLLPTPTGNRLAPADVPACKGAQVLEQPVPFTWAGITDVVSSTPETNWTYYRCDEPQVAVSAFYRHWLPDTSYHWLEVYWEERPAAIMGNYLSMTGNPPNANRWLYLWFVPDPSTSQASFLVAAWSLAPKSC